MVLWLSEQDFRLLPKEVLALQNEGLEIRITEDLKSYTKILPAIDAFPDASICTADDDVYYPPEWLEELVSEHDPQTVTCHRAHEIRFTADGKMLPYGSWDFDFRDSRTGTAIFPTGVGGVLYPPNVLAHDANDRRMAFELSPSNDDAWLYWMGRRNGAVYKRVGKWRSFLVWPGSQERALSKVNVQEGQNDIQFARLFDYYGSPEKKG